MITTTQLANGLTVIVEEMDHVESVSYDMLLPGGLIVDEASTVGASLIFAELLGRGAGGMDSRQLSAAFDGAGIRHGEGVGTDRFTLSGSLVADKLERALELLSLMVLEPTLAEDEIPSIQSVMLQDLAALNDNPARKSMVELTKRYYPAPFNRSSLGEEAGIAGSSRLTMMDLYGRYFVPERAILSVAGKVKAAEVLSWVEKHLGAWKGTGADLPTFGAISPHRYYPLEVESAQLQIVMAAPSVKFSEPSYYDGKVAVSLLGASMFGRLFVEVREKRGLCYSVYARHGATASYGTVTAYVGTTPERAQESLDVLLREFDELRGSVTEEEVSRAKTNLKATLVMGEESPGSRAASNAGDWWLLKRIRSLQEISAAIDAVSLESIDGFLAKYPFRPCSILTLGSKPLEIPAGVVG
jgi:predicted Zn-dependent peptidase